MATKRGRTPNDQQRGISARIRFRRLIRRVYLNRLWLQDIDEHVLSLNVKKNITMLVRKQAKIGLLTLAEKAMINTHPAFRSVEERKKLVSLMTGLTCFAKIPPKVRARLVPVVRFLCLGPNRVIIKEGDLPIFVYFILAGEIEVTRTVYDHFKKCYVQKLEYLCGPGDCIGDIEMIEEIPRRNTYRTISNVEVLMFWEDDFNAVLAPTMTELWMEKKSAMMRLGYFDYFTDDQFIRACRIGEIREYESLESIYHEDKGLSTFVHFVLSGECMILQCLKMRVRIRKGMKIFQLTEVEKPVETKDETLTFREIMELLRPTKKDTALNFSLTTDKKSKQTFTNLDTKSIEISCGLRSPESSISIHSSDLQSSKFGDFSECNGEGGDSDWMDDDVYKTESDSTSKRQNKDEGAMNIFKNLRNNKNKKTKFAGDKDLLSEIEDLNNSSSSSFADLFKEIKENPEQNSMFSSEEKGIENRFIDVGSISFRGIFGLGEELEHRVIMARTTVQCLVIPRFWLLEEEQNPGNLWQRKRFYLDSTIPSRENLFQNFLTTRKWQKFKNDLVHSQLDPNSRSNATKEQDIPIILKILEADDD